MKTYVHETRRSSWLLAAALALSVNAAALFGRQWRRPSRSEGAPMAQALEIRTYRGIPYRAQFLATDSGGGATDLRRGGGAEEGHRPDRRRQLHLHAGGGRHRHRQLHLYRHRQPPATCPSPPTVTVTIEKTKSGVTYADIGGQRRGGWPPRTWRRQGIFTGARRSETSTTLSRTRTVSRSEFLAMVLETAGAGRPPPSP